MSGEPVMAECRCCRRPVQSGMLACKEHWFMLPRRLRQEINLSYHGGRGMEYVAHVEEADDIWKAAGLWQPGQPKGATMYTVIDTEGSGLFNYKLPADAEGQPRLAQLCMIHVNADLAIESEENYFVRPVNWSMDPKATEINGLTDDFLNEHGHPIEEVLSAYQNAILAGRAIVAFNAQHDCKTMRAELRRAGLDDLFEKTKNVCVMRKANGVILKAGGKKGWPSLAEAREFLGLTSVGAHKAEKDAYDALMIFRHLREQGVDLTPEVHYAGDNNPAKPAGSPSRAQRRQQGDLLD